MEYFSRYTVSTIFKLYIYTARCVQYITSIFQKILTKMKTFVVLMNIILLDLDISSRYSKKYSK